jgi:hypothetical protein
MEINSKERRANAKSNEAALDVLAPSTPYNDPDLLDIKTEHDSLQHIRRALMKRIETSEEEYQIKMKRKKAMRFRTKMAYHLAGDSLRI